MAPEPLVKDLTPEEIAMAVRVIDAARRRQRIMLLGYCVALGVFIIGVVAAFYTFGKLEEGTFTAAVFLVPPALAGIILLIFGRLAEKKAPRVSR